MVALLSGCDHDNPPAPANHVPVILSGPSQQATEDSPFSFVVRFEDPDGPDTLITFSSVPSWLTVSCDTVSGTPGEEDNDTGFVVTVSDGLAADTLAVEITVVGVNDAPVIVSDDTLFVTGSIPAGYRPQVIDPDNQILTVTFPYSPEWATAEADSLYGTPPDSCENDSIRVVASDGELADTVTIFVRFLPPLAVYGDSRTGHDEHRRVVSQMMAVYPSVVFHSGDLVENGNLQSDWDIFNEITADLRDRAEFFPALGNHELQSQLFFDNFELPNNEQWYSVVRNRVHFIILNSCVDIGPSSEQYQWLVGDLSSVGDSVWFTAVAFHHPPYSTGAHVEDELGLREILVPLFEQYGVDIVFNGHDHDYERSYCGDIFYIVTGGGGAPLRDQTRDHPCSQLFLMEYHFCKLSILPDGMFITVINDIGQTIDQYELAF